MSATLKDVSLKDTLKNIFHHHKSTLLEQGLATCAAAVSRLSMFLIVLVNTRFLPATEFGLFALLLLIFNLVTALISGGGDMWLNRFTRHNHTIRQKAPMVARFYLSISLGLAFIVATVALIIAVFFHTQFQNQGLALSFCLFWAVSYGLTETLLAILRTQSQIKIFFLIRDFLNPALLMASIFLFRIHDVSKFFLIASLIWTSTVIALIYHVFSKRASYMPKSSLLSWKNTGRGLIIHTLKLMANNLSSRLNNGFDTLILAKFISIEIIGRYRLCSQISNAFIVIQHFVFLALPWHMRASISKESKGAKTLEVRQFILILTTLLALVFLLLFANILLKLLGQNYHGVSKLLSAFLLIRFSELLWGPQHEILVSNNKIFSDTSANICGLLIGISTFFIATVYFDFLVSGIIAAGLSSVVAQFYRFIMIQKLNHIHQVSSVTISKKYLPWLPLMTTLSGVGYFVIQSFAY